MKARQRKTTVIVLSAIVAICIIVIIINQVISSRIRKEVDKLLTAEEFSNYSITIRKVRANILTQSIYLKDIHVSTDTLEKNNFLDIRMNRLRINDIHIRAFLKDGNLDIDKIMIDEPRISIGMDFKPPAKKKKGRPEREITSLSINKLRITDGVFQRFNNKITDIELNEIYFNITDVFLPFDNPSDKQLRFSDFIVAVKAGSLFTDDKMYKLSFDELHSNYCDSSLKMYSVNVIPQYEKYKFSKMLGYQTDRFDAYIKEVSLSGLQYNDLFRENNFIAQKVNLKDVKADVFRDKQIPRKAGFYPPLPQQALRKLTFKLKIDTVNLERASVKYSEHVPGAAKAGYVYFTDLNSLIVNLNNAPGFFGVKNRFSVYATGALMSECLARVRIHIPVISQSDTFYFSGSLQPMSLTKLNAMTENNQNIRIESGDMKSIIFEGQANNDYAIGDMEFLYDNLKIKILKPDHDEIQQEKKFFSFLVNNVIRKQNPPKESSPPFIASMYFERDKEKGVINFLWKTLLSGVKTTITPGRKGLRKKE